jgi:hypothetical protein
MDLTTAFTIIGIVVTAAFGLWGLYVTIKSRYPGQITLVRESAIALFDTIVKNFPEISIIHKGKAVSEGLVLLRVAFLNTGSKDITREMVANELALNLPDGFKWLNAKVVGASPEAHGAIKRGKQSIQFDLGLFRCKEFVRIEALAEVPLPAKDVKARSSRPEEILSNALQVSHRIADTQRVVVTELNQSMRAKRRFKMSLILVLSMAALLVAHTLYSYFTGWPADFRYDLQIEDGKSVVVKAFPKTNRKVIVKGIDNKDFKEVMPINDFITQSKVNPTLTFALETKGFLIAVTLYIIIPLFLCLYYLWEQRKAQMIRSLLLIYDDLPFRKEDVTQAEKGKLKK